MKQLSLSQKLVLTALPMILFSCGTPNDRDAVINPKVSGKMITISNVSDITNASDASTALYYRPSSTKTGTATSARAYTVGLSTNAGSASTTSVPGKEISPDVQKILGLVASADRKAFLNKHLDSGGMIAFVYHADNIRIYGVSDLSTISKIDSGPLDLTLVDLKNAKNSKLAKSAATERSRTDDPAEATRFIEIAAVEIEKSGVLESEKSEYGETKPLLNIVTNLPISVSTHVLLKVEVEFASAKKLSDIATGSASAGPAVPADNKK
jgi:hypothetical protein